ncbi:AAA domain-containing protein [Gongronella butleri]|nr:AAA domain-containing protein [Gongronella butleri]
MSTSQPHKQARRRLKQLGKTLTAQVEGWTDSEDDDLIQEVHVKSVRIGDVVMPVAPPLHPELVPLHEAHLYDNSQEMLRHLRWMMQKDKLGQDIFLIGPPGPLRRQLVMKYAEMTQREIEYVPLSKDVTDADLKQRRELTNGTSYYVDQSAVRAAIHGRILILDGIEKAERNVLPILNNLLENREMSLEDGRFLTTKDVKDGDKNFEKVDSRFRVFALGLPVPPYVGYPLDPPLRSRFQSRDIKTPSFTSQMDHLMALTKNKIDRALLEQLVSVGTVLGLQGDSTVASEVEVPEFPMSLDNIALVAALLPHLHPRFLVDLLYPYPLLPTCDLEQLGVIEAAYRRFGIRSPVVEAHEEARQTFSNYTLADLEQQRISAVSVDGEHPIHTAIATFAHVNEPPVALSVYCGPNAFGPAEFYIETPYHKQLFSSMVLVHASGQDMCLVGTYKGVGKSALVRHFARHLGYTVDYIPLYRDMSSRDLLQRRSTTPTGDTVWENSLLVDAALRGHLAVLDGIEALSYGTLNTLQRLVSERETQLPDGTRLISARRYELLMKKNKLTPEELTQRKFLPIHPAFRILALARSTSQNDSKPGSWLSCEILSMFPFLVVDAMPSDEEQQVLSSLSPGVDDAKLSQLLAFARRLRRDPDDTVRMLSSALSTRQLNRICHRVAYFADDSLYKAVHKAALSRFMPHIAREALHGLMVANDIKPPVILEDAEKVTIELLPSREKPETLRIGNIEEPVLVGGDPMLIPNVVFHENPAHNEILMEMLKDYQLGEHLLLIGNQGVGKNKLADYFLQLLQLPRHYIQLHRDSTVQSLTTTPAIREGVLHFEDSALVKAVRDGTILVVDEADKAPTYVTAVLKSLVEDGQMVLGDGRRIVSKESDVQQGDKYILIHPGFRMIVLANRPGYPFLGNDFYREIGDVFACHAVDNPDLDSEMYLLRKYGPDVPEDLLRKLSSAFTDLRKLTDEGLISYPYSTRELVNIVRHLQNYPSEGISKILQNVFDFDQYDQASKELLIEIFEKHGIPIGLDSEFSMALGELIDLGAPVATEKWTRVGKQKQAAKVVVEDIAIRGGWDLVNERKMADLDRKEGRSTTFTELLYTFTVPTRGEALDIASDDDGTLYAVTTSPVTLHRVLPNHMQVESIDMYEYFPLQRSPPRLRIAMVRLQGRTKYVALHNPANNELLCCDFAAQKVVSVVLRGLEPVKSIMCANLSNEGLLVFYQEDQAQIALVDFATTKQWTIRLPVRIEHLLVVDKHLWIARGSRDGLAYAVHLDQHASAPEFIVEPLQVHGQQGYAVDRVTNVLNGPVGNPDGTRLLQHAQPSRFASVAHGLSFDELLTKGQSATIATYFDKTREADVLPTRTHGTALYLQRTHQVATVYPSTNGRAETTLDILNPATHQVWRIRLPVAVLGGTENAVSGVTSLAHFQVDRHAVAMCELASGQLVTMDNVGTVRIFQVSANDLYRAANTWKQMVGVDQKALSVIYETDQPSSGNDMDQDGSSRGASDKCDGGDGHGSGGKQGTGTGGESDGGQGAEGEGEGQGGGSGGGGGGFNGNGQRDNENGREEATLEDINSLRLKTADDMPEQINEARKELHDNAMQKMLNKLEMNRGDYDMFQRYMENVRREVRELRVILESVEAKNKERVWLKNQSSGDLDDTKIIEGLTGERAIYKKRGEDDPELGLFQDKPKRMNFVFDLSASMFRFNSHDRRLERSLEVALMIMEAFRGFEHKFEYQITGHSGDTANLPFIKPGQYPKTEKDEFEILSKMRAHAQYCLSGDNTLGAAAHAVKEIVAQEGDDYLVAILSDANIAQYNIHPKDIARVLKSDDRVTAQMIFIGSIQDQAEQLQKALGSQAHICVENKDLPKIIKSLFLSSMIK